METPNRSIDSAIVGMETPPSGIFPFFKNLMHSPVRSTFSGLLPFSKKPLQIAERKNSCQKSLFKQPQEQKEERTLNTNLPQNLFSQETETVILVSHEFVQNASIVTTKQEDVSALQKEINMDKGADVMEPTTLAMQSSSMETESWIGLQETVMAVEVPHGERERLLSEETITALREPAVETVEVSTIETEYLIATQESVTNDAAFSSPKISKFVCGVTDIQDIAEESDFSLKEPTAVVSNSQEEQTAPGLCIRKLIGAGSQACDITKVGNSLSPCRVQVGHSSDLSTGAACLSSVPSSQKVSAVVKDIVRSMVPGTPCSNVALAKKSDHGGPSSGTPAEEEKSKKSSKVPHLHEEDACSTDDSEASEYKASESDSSESEEDEKSEDEEVKPTISYAKKQYTTETRMEIMRKPCGRLTNPGRRYVGKRIYDSVLGRTCHWCRQKTVEDHVQCWKCPIRFCGMCLINRNGEYIQREMQKGAKWVCPKCRGGCGPGCNNCCNCGPCRRDQRMGPTGHIIRVVKAAGFTNAHDYLIHQKTGETHDEIVSRKHGRSWINGGTANNREEDTNFRSFSRSLDGSDGSGSVAGDGDAVDMEIDTSNLEDHKVVITRAGVKRKGTEWKMSTKRMRGAAESDPSQSSRLQKRMASQSMETVPSAPRPKGRPPRLKSPTEEPQQFSCKKPHERKRSKLVGGVKLEGSVKCKVDPQCLEKSPGISNFTSSKVKLEKLEEKVTFVASTGLGASSRRDDYLSGEKKISAYEHSQTDGSRKVGDEGTNCTSLQPVKIERNAGERKISANKHTQAAGLRKVGDKGTNCTSLVKIEKNAGERKISANEHTQADGPRKVGAEGTHCTSLQVLVKIERTAGERKNSVNEYTQADGSRKVGDEGNNYTSLPVAVKIGKNAGTPWDTTEKLCSPGSHSSVDDIQGTALENLDENEKDVDAQNVEIEEEAYVLSQTSSSDNTASPVLRTPSSDVSVILEAVGSPSNKDERIELDATNTCSVGTSQNPSNVFDLANSEATQTNNLSSRKRPKTDVHSGDKWSLPTDVQGEAYNQKLKAVLAETVEWKQLADMWELATRRKPLLKLRQTRGRTLHVTTKDEGLSYLDHHPDLAARLKASSNPEDKLMLLRGFFFWLQHSCMEGAYKPWASIAQDKGQGGDCVETDGPDCEVLAVVLPLDEKKDVGYLVKSSMQPSDSVIIDLDDDEEEVTEASMRAATETLGVKPEVNPQEKLPKATTCLLCSQKFGMEKMRQRALFKSCGHIHTCVSCADTLWKLNKCKCPKCGLHQEKKPKSMLDFTTTPGEPDIEFL